MLELGGAAAQLLELVGGLQRPSLQLRDPLFGLALLAARRIGHRRRLLDRTPDSRPTTLSVGPPGLGGRGPDDLLGHNAESRLGRRRGAGAGGEADGLGHRHRVEGGTLGGSGPGGHLDSRGVQRPQQQPAADRGGGVLVDHRRVQGLLHLLGHRAAEALTQVAGKAPALVGHRGGESSPLPGEIAQRRGVEVGLRLAQ